MAYDGLKIGRLRSLGKERLVGCTSDLPFYSCRRVRSAMETITFRIPESLLESIDDEADEYGVSRSEYIRRLIERGREYERVRQEMRITQNKLEEARDQMKHRDQLEQKVDVLAKRIEEREETALAPFPIRWFRWWRSR
jgi:Arc/MetJ-type ribon-helix-helix transcriptional regulator